MSTKQQFSELIILFIDLWLYIFRIYKWIDNSVDTVHPRCYSEGFVGGGAYGQPTHFFLLKLKQICQLLPIQFCWFVSLLPFIFKIKLHLFFFFSFFKTSTFTTSTALIPENKYKWTAINVYLKSKQKIFTVRCEIKKKKKGHFMRRSEKEVKNEKSFKLNIWLDPPLLILWHCACSYEKLAQLISKQKSPMSTWNREITHT